MKSILLLVLGLFLLNSHSYAKSDKNVRSIASERSLDMEDGAYAQVNGQIASYFIEDYLTKNSYVSKDCGPGKYYEKCWKKSMTVEIECVQFPSGNHTCELKPTQKQK